MTSEASSAISVERTGPGGSVALITFDRPDAHNAFDVATIGAFDRAVRSVVESADVRVIVLTGAGKVFCAGADIAEMESSQDRHGLFRALTRHLHAALVDLRRCDKVVITAINGVAAGGGFGLALVGDLRVAGASASFTSAYHKLGVNPDGGLTYLLPRIVGAGKAFDLIFTDRRIDAQEAFQLGLVTEVVPDDELRTRALAEAERLAKGPAFAMGKSKILLNASWENDLERHLELERTFITLAARAEELPEGIAAFRQKRPPSFSK